jgi:hypothetical protein
VLDAVKYRVCIGLRFEDYDRVKTLMEELSVKYPEQRWKIYAFPEAKLIHGRESYPFILVVVADSYDKAHKIGLSLVKKHFPKIGIADALYWVKEP